MNHETVTRPKKKRLTALERMAAPHPKETAPLPDIPAQPPGEPVSGADTGSIAELPAPEVGSTSMSTDPNPRGALSGTFSLSEPTFLHGRCSNNTYLVVAVRGNATLTVRRIGGGNNTGHRVHCHPGFDDLGLNVSRTYSGTNRSGVGYRAINGSDAFAQLIQMVKDLSHVPDVQVMHPDLIEEFLSTRGS